MDLWNRTQPNNRRPKSEEDGVRGVKRSSLALDPQSDSTHSGQSNKWAIWWPRQQIGRRTDGFGMLIDGSQDTESGSSNLGKPPLKLLPFEEDGVLGLSNQSGPHHDRLEHLTLDGPQFAVDGRWIEKKEWSWPLWWWWWWYDGRSFFLPNQ